MRTESRRSSLRMSSFIHTSLQFGNETRNRSAVVRNMVGQEWLAEHAPFERLGEGRFTALVEQIDIRFGDLINATASGQS